MVDRRNGVIDTYRGLCILLVVLGHTRGLPSEIHRYVYSFHMPAFFILSGFLFNSSKARADAICYVREKFHRLVIPAWVMGAICGLPFIAMLLLGKVKYADFVELLIGTAIGFPRPDGNFLSTPLWFLFCLFSLEILAVVLTRFSGRDPAVPLLVIGGIGFSVCRETPFIPFDLHIAMPAAFFWGRGSHKASRCDVFLRGQVK